MSAYLVSDDHVSSIVAAAVALDLVPASLATDAGRMLLRENMRSLAARYRDPIDEAHLAAYIYDPSARARDLAETLSDISCLDYQSCEHDGWEASNARAFLTALETAIGDARIAA